MIRQPIDLHEWIAALVETTEDTTVSTDDVIRKTRSRFPGLSVRDEDLISLITTRAAAHGRAVEFAHSLRS
jgi:hypothetical protein